MPAQDFLWCTCGATIINRHGACAQCDRRRRLSKEDFGGLRDQVLARDGHRCQVCGAVDDLLVHHRQPSRNLIRMLLTLCRPCHQRVHHTRRPAYGFDGLLRELWREMHPRLAEQMKFRLQLSPVIPDPPTIQTGLFEAA